MFASCQYKYSLYCSVFCCSSSNNSFFPRKLSPLYMPYTRVQTIRRNRIRHLEFSPDGRILRAHRNIYTQIQASTAQPYASTKTLTRNHNWHAYFSREGEHKKVVSLILMVCSKYFCYISQQLYASFHFFSIQ